MQSERTDGEKLFESYLSLQGITDYDYEPASEGKQKRPDFVVRIGGREYIFDIKDFAPRASETDVICFDPLPPIREKIGKVKEQFKEFKDRPCCLVLYNEGNPNVMLSNPAVMFGSMYGDPAIVLPLNPKNGTADQSSAKPAFTKKGKMIQPYCPKPQNTTISALITLRYINEKHLGIVVWENRFARNPLPRELFRGTYDERYGDAEGKIQRIFAGEGILAYEGLKEIPPAKSVNPRK